MATEDDTVDLRFLDWKEATTSVLIDRIRHVGITEQVWAVFDAIRAGDMPEDFAVVVSFLGAELNNRLHQELSNDYPELAEALRYLSFDEALHAVYCATHGQH